MKFSDTILNGTSLVQIGLATTILALAGCNADSGDNTGAGSTLGSASGFVFPDDAIYIAQGAANGSDITTELVNALSIPDADAVYVLPEGTFTITTTITIPSGDGITLTGYGKEETILNFETSTGDDGIKFEGGLDLTIRDLAVYEAPKNGIKVINANGVHMIETATVWSAPLTDGDNSNNGAYGLYPLKSENILIENSYAYGSADAGIYVGQSSNIVVRGNHAEHNVAGIEIENSTMADVYNNTATGNTGGILTFDLPGLDKAYGGNVRIFNNVSTTNDLDNVAGGTVGIVPPGTGVLVFATSDVEVYNNQLTANDTSAVAIASYFMADDDVANYPANYGATMATGWSPLVKNVYIHDNTIEDNGGDARGALITDMVAGYESAGNSSGVAQVFPAILYDGIGEALANSATIAGFTALVTDTQAIADGVDYDTYAAGDDICEANNTTTGSATTQNVGQVYPGNDPSAAALLIETMASTTLLECTQTRLDPAVVTINGTIYGCTGDDSSIAACAL